jgi:hypothetical protein
MNWISEYYWPTLRFEGLPVRGHMDAHVLHVGADDCHRVAVLRSVGYRVVECLSPAQIASAMAATKRVDAVFVTESEGISHEQAVLLARQRWAPVILFQRANSADSSKQFDMVVEPLTSPSKWLRDVSALLEWSRGVRARAMRNAEPPRVLEMPRVGRWDRSLRAEADSLPDWRSMRP